MLSSGFTNAPVTRSLLVAVVLSAFLTTITDTKYYLWIEVRPHLFDYHQFWRLLTWQFCYTNSTEVLFAAMTLYQLRVIERLWGSRKFAVRYLPTTTTTTSSNPTWKRQWMEPQTSGMGTSGDEENGYGMNLTSKSTAYILPLQLALSQLPGSAIAAGIGWLVGFAYRREILPGATRWRIPDWVVGGTRRKERYDSLRRRMEGEAGRTTGVDTNQDQARRRGVVGGLVDQIRGAA
ncbi:hypothetical protein LTR35_014413 [Friedmanniomyces endolithicus]|uniref:Peptidase S54 rhomboid domain-containing protein n=1 Tax=Friedmanniomyces endolithicus TaxID=329885 RepID=A0AAN6FEI7_9PEZI|nr:hypothetical protein LTR35_014413 [Friedmanniomyces endolithicus]KAK0279345.1 hypothetical protein LTS00_013450 [Friedmanniomyces endolithicus]KAK0312401.1 hypothetical protein LTR82_013871 [Friedmanniomyces endolithicus]KAK0988699.1 hypothetical protein LTR54_012659 [Friedmanniomyces endolithicus]